MSTAAAFTARPDAPHEFTCAHYAAELAAATDEARTIVAGLTEAQGQARPAPDRWSVAECLAHLAATAQVYLPPLDEAIRRGHEAGRTSTRPFRPGIVSRWLVSAMEPPPKRPLRTQPAIRPRADVSLADAIDAFTRAQDDLRARVTAAEGLDLGRVHLRSPLMPLLRMNLGTCFGFLAAHERRHLWQARQVRESLGI